MKILQYLSESYQDRLFLRGTPSLGLFPGDILRFNYSDGTERLGLVVKSKRAPNGKFLSSRNNLLLNIFLLEDISLPMLDVIVNTLYRDKNRCSYSNSPKILGAFFTRDSFRTFNLKKVSRIYKIEINR